MDFKTSLRLLRRRWKTIVLFVLLALAASGALTVLATPTYQSTVKVFVSADSNALANPLGSTLYSTTRVQSYANLADHQDLMEQVITELDLDTSPRELAEQVTAVVEPDTVIILLGVTAKDATLATRIADAAAQALVDYVELLETPEGAESALLRATVTDPASFQPEPVSPRPVLNLAFAGLIGLLLGVAFAVARELLDNTAKSPEDVEAATGAPVMASIGADSSVSRRPLLTDLRGFSPRGEAFRMLRTNLQFLDLDNPPKSFVVTSAVAGEGKTTTATNLAIALAEAGRRVLLVDGDLRRPRAARLLGLETAIGLTTVLVRRTALKDSIQRHAASGVHVLACGPIPPNPSEILQARATHDLLRQLREDYDAVVIDAPPLLPVTDAAILATAADGAIIVVRHGRTSNDQMQAAAQRLETVGGRLFGTVVNMVPRRLADNYYYYYYDDATSRRDRKRARREARAEERRRIPQPAATPPTRSASGEKGERRKARPRRAGRAQQGAAVVDRDPAPAPEPDPTGERGGQP